MWTLNGFPQNPALPPKEALKPKHLLLHSLSKSGHLDEALSVLLKSHPSIPPTTPTTNLEAYSHLLHSFITHKSLRHGELLHRHLLHSTPSLLRHPLIKSKLITLYSVCARIESARLVFDEDDDEPSWTAMVVAFSKNGLHEDSLSLYAGNASWRSDFADSAALKSCSTLSAVRLGRAVHARVLKSAREPDQVVLNALVRLYVKCGTLDEALKAFDGMPQRNVVSWNSLLSGFVGRGFFFEFLDLFRRMQIESSVGFSWVTLTTVLSACSQVTALYKGREVHAQMVKSREEPDIPVLNSLMDMYAKCGVVDYCERVFRGMGCRDLMSWNTMLTCYAINGCARDALELFDEMVGRGRGGIKPDGVTFVALLSSCAHAGFVDEGQRLFDRMDVEFGVRKNVEHFACLVDLLGRAGLIGEAFEVTEKMPMRPGGSVWGSLLNSCRLHGDVDLGEIAAKRLFEIEPNNAGNYVLFSNMFAREKMWEEAKKVRVVMEEKGLKKEVGHSWVQVGSRIHSFIAGGGVSFRSSSEYKRVWEELVEAMEREGCVPDMDVVLHDVDEGTKAEWVCGHSERIAVVFGLLNSGDGIPIRITKNLRVCNDCHNVMKVVSKVTRRLIVMRDTNRFHHFRNGACSCGDFW